MDIRLYERMFESMNVGVAYHKMVYSDMKKPMDYVFLMVNESFRRFTGLDNREIVGKSVTQVIPGIVHDQFNWIEYYGTLVSENRSDSLEQYSDTLQKWFRIDVTVFEEQYFMTTFTDITSDKLVEMEIIEKQKIRYELAMNGSNDGFWDWDIVTNDLYFSPRWKAQLGYEENELENNFETFLSLLANDDKEYVQEKVDDYLSGKLLKYDVQFRMISKDGRIVWIRARGEAIRDDKGMPIRMAGSHTDITHEIEQNRIIKEKEENFSSFFETADDMLLVASKEGQVIYVNHAVTKKLGYMVEELSQMHVLDFHPKSYIEEAKVIFGEMFEGKRSSCPLPLQKKNGENLAVETRVWFGKWDGQECMFAIIKDLSYKEAALDKFNKLFENNPALMAITDMKTHRFTDVNNAFLNKLGYKNEEIIGKTSGELQLFVDQTKQEEIALKLMTQGKIKNEELKVRSKDGSIHIGLFSGEVIDNQMEQSLLTVMMDITDLKESEYRLHRKDQILEGVAEATKILLEGRQGAEIFSRALSIIGKASTADRAYIFKNNYEGYQPTTSQIYEWVANDVIPQFGNDELIDLPFEDIKEIMDILTTGKKVVMQINDFGNQVRQHLKSQDIHSLMVLPIFIKDFFWGFVGFNSCEDSHEWPKAEQAILETFAYSLGRAIERDKILEKLEEQKVNAELASASKTVFLANMSHEIRTPINGLMGMLALLDYTNLNEEQKEYVQEAQKSSESLLYLINDILDLSKIEAGKMILEQIEFDVRGCIEEAVSSFEHRAADKNIDLPLLINANVPDCAIGDPARIRQILGNLLSNGIKFTTEGYVSTEVNLLEQTDKISLEILVKDTGIGMDEDTMSKIFSPFEQGDISTTRKYGGTGLGLAITHQIVQMMQGTIHVESAIGEGTTFTITIELGKVLEARELRSYSYESIEGRKILIVDDQKTNRHVIKKFLEETGANVYEAKSSSDALSVVLKENLLKKPFDIILLDYIMPDIDGMDFVRMASQIDGQENTKYILATSLAQKGDIKNVHEAGFHGYLTKPVKRDDLLKVVSLVVGMNNHLDEPEKVMNVHLEKEIRRLRKPKILVVEDNRVNQKVVLKTLQKEGYICDLANNGREAVEAFKRGYYDVIFMDCQMPIMDGYEATRLIRKETEKGTKVKIIAMTAYAMTGDAEKCFEAGMDDYLSKPLDFDKVIDLINKIPLINHYTNAIIDKAKEKLLEQSQFSKDDVDELFYDFIELLKNYYLEMETSLSLQEFNSLSKYAHQIKGAAGNLRLYEIADLCINLERYSRENDSDKCRSALDELGKLT